MTSTPAPQSRLQWHSRIWQLSLPIIFSNISVPLVGAVDTAVVGHLAQVELIGAVALGASIFSLVFWTFGFLRMATSGLVAQAFGSASVASDNNTEIPLIFRRSLLVAGVLACVVLALQKPLLTFSLWLLGTDNTLNAPTSEYYNIRIWAAPATLANYVILGTLIGLQNMRAVLIFQLFLNVLNILLDLLFVPLLGFGISGVAAATVISEYSALLLGFFLIRNHASQPAGSSPWKSLLEARALRQLFQLNTNIFIRTLLLVLSFFYFNAKSAGLGAVALAANAILLQILHICAYALDGFAHAVETLSGHAWGSQKRQHFNMAVKYSTLQSLVVATLMSIGIALFGKQLIGLFTNQSEVLEIANLLLSWLVALPIISVWCYQLDGIFIGTTHSKEMRNAMVFSALVFLLTTQVLTRHMGNSGLWLSFSIFMITRALSLLYYYPRISNNPHFNTTITPQPVTRQSTEH
jgi:MATE family multidrug resistance protein